MVQIELDDVNDNGPIFSPSDLTGSVMENRIPGTTVLNLATNTTDPDLPPNRGPYQFYAISENSYFQIGVNGVVKTKVELDRESTPQFDIQVRVLDNGNPTMSSILTFHVKVLDANDNPPKARNMDVQVALYAGGFPASAIADVRPTDVDLVGIYTCSVNDGGNDLFYIQSGCNLHLRNRPSKLSYSVAITGSDGNHTVPYTVNVRFIEFSDPALETMVMLQISSIQASTFMLSKFSNFKSSIEKLDLQKNMQIYSITDMDQTNDVLLFVAASDLSGNLISHDALKQLMISKKSMIESESDIIISTIGFSVCNQSLCNAGECLSHVTVNSKFGFLDSPAFVLSSPELVPDYKCNCPPQFTGTNCDIPVNPCGSGYCENGGTCQNNAKCNCPPGWDGEFCQTDKIECLLFPCKNGGTCQNSPGSYKCLCKDGFTGINCDTGSDNCTPDPCNSRGECKNELSGFRCECSYIYWGTRCEHVSQGFQEGSYMEFQSLDLYQRDSSFDITFATTLPNGLLLYNPSSDRNIKDFIALEIVNSEVHFSFNLGDATATRLHVKKNVTTGDWYRVEIVRSSEVRYSLYTLSFCLSM